MTYKELQLILWKYFSKSWTKHLLAKNSKKRPSDEKKYLIQDNDGIPVEAWRNIRKWLEEQQKLKGE
ncbi:hypothetical protein CDOMC_1215 [Campylobacter sp. RM16192]|nr:hypothetical protein CDOMC_1215 [Campylobacter sp. RM16192]